MSGLPPPPSPIVGLKLASIAMHADEALGPYGLPVDADVVRTMMRDPDVQAYLQELDALALLPVRRNP